MLASIVTSSKQSDDHVEPVGCGKDGTFQYISNYESETQLQAWGSILWKLSLKCFFENAGKRIALKNFWLFLDRALLHFCKIMWVLVLSSSELQWRELDVYWVLTMKPRTNGTGSVSFATLKQQIEAIFKKLSFLTSRFTWEMTRQAN